VAFRPSRGVSRKAGESGPRSRSRLPRDSGSCSEVRNADSIELAPWCALSPCDLCRFRAGPSGLLSSSSPPDLTPVALLSAGYPSPRSRSALQPQPHAQCGCTSPGVSFPFSARRSLASVYPVGHHDRPEPSVLRVSHPLDGFSALPHAGPTTQIPRETCLDSPQRSWGFPSSDRSSWTFRSTTGRSESRSPLHGSLPPRDEHVLACSPSLRLSRRVSRPPF